MARRTWTILLCAFILVGCGRGVPRSLRGETNSVDAGGPAMPGPDVGFPPDQGGPAPIDDRCLASPWPDFSISFTPRPDPMPGPVAYQIVNVTERFITLLDFAGRQASIDYSGAPVSLFNGFESGEQVTVIVQQDPGDVRESTIIAILDEDFLPRLILFDTTDINFTLGGNFIDDVCEPAMIDPPCGAAVTQRLRVDSVELEMGDEVSVSGSVFGLAIAYRYLDGRCAGPGQVRRAGYILTP